MNLNIFRFLLYFIPISTSSHKFHLKTVPMTQLSIEGTICHTHVVLDDGVSFKVNLTTPHTIYNIRETPKQISLSNSKGFSCVLLLLAPFSKKNYLINMIHHYFEEFVGFPHLIKDWTFDDFNIQPLLKQTVIFIFTSKPLDSIATVLGENTGTTSLYRFVIVFHYHQNITFSPDSYLTCFSCGENVPLLLKYQSRNQFNLSAAMEYLKPFQNKHFYANFLTQDLLEFTKSIDHLKNSVGRKIPIRIAKNFPPGLLQSSASAKMLLEFYLLQEVIAESNGSMSYCFYEKTETFYNCPQHSNYKYTKVSAGETLLERVGIKIVAKSLSIPLYPVSHSFITCYKEPIVSYRFYIDPYKLNLWIVFFASILFLYIFIRLLVRNEYGNKRFCSYSVALFLVSTVTDDSCGRPEELKKNSKLRCTLGAWYLATIVFVNAYIGLAITSLTKPFGVGSISSFRNLAKVHYSHEQIVNEHLW